MKPKWEWRPLGDICKTASGATPLKSTKEYYEGGNIPWLLSGEVAQGEITGSKKFITRLGLENSAAKLFPEDSVLVAMYGATAGQVGILRFEASTNQAICAILPNDKFLPKFLFYLFLHKKDDLVATASGNAQPNISQIKIKRTKVPIIAVEKQRQIVAVLDKAFEGIATAAASAQKNLINARAIFESYLQFIFSDKKNDWPENTLGDVCGFQNGFAFKSKSFRDSGTPVLRISNIQGERIEARRLVYVHQNDYKENLDRYKVSKGALLIAMSGATTGKVGILNEDKEYYLNQRVGKFEPSGKLIKSYLFFYLITKVEENLSISAGSAQPNLSTAQIKGFIIPLPTTDEQTRLGKKFATIQNRCRKLEEIAELKLTALSELKQSLLQKAFAGELT